MGKKNVIDTWKRLQEIVKKDKRYSLQSYQFIFEALDYTASKLGKKYSSSRDEERHVTGQELSEGIRQYALEKYGFMARSIFKQWGISKSKDFGEIVFNLVDSGLMGKTESDSLEDFKDLYDFKTEFDDKFKFDGAFNLTQDWDIFRKKK
ncbi:MAG: Minf_1886 family protein [Candidatus Scalinduaceae bacterium]